MRPRSTITWFINTVVVPLSLILATAIAIGLSLCTPCAAEDENWLYVVWTTEADHWYVNPAVSYAKKGKILGATASLKFVPKKGSSTHQHVARLLEQDRVNPERFEYFLETVDVDCTTGAFAISRITYYDSNGRPFYDIPFAQPKQYSSRPGSPYELIAGYLCSRGGSSVCSIAKSLLLTITP